MKKHFKQKNSSLVRNILTSLSVNSSVSHAAWQAMYAPLDREIIQVLTMPPIGLVRKSVRDVVLFPVWRKVMNSVDRCVYEKTF